MKQRNLSYYPRADVICISIPRPAGGRGEVFIRLLLSTEKDQTLTAQEHKHLLKILFANELQKSQCAPFKWNGEFSKEVGS